jgi:hypothetical protein
MLWRCLLLSLLLASLLAGPGLAQSPTPLADLDIALWPEYDRPEVLVIFRGRIADAATLPAQLSFSLPATVQAMHAVAFVDDARGALVDIPDYAFSPSGDGKALSFSTPGRQFQFEYYHTDVLNKSGEMRSLSFSFTPSADIANLTLEVQQPTAAQAFTSTPPPSTTQVGQNGLTDAFYELGAVSAGDSRSLRASYTRSTDQLSVAEEVSLPSTTAQTPVEVGGGGLRDNLGLILVGLGVLLLTGSLVYWFWSQRAVVVPEPGPRQSSARVRRAARPRPPDGPRPPAPRVTGETLAAYCHRCGTKFRGDARYCHACGAERRAESP